jgi:ATP-dependent Clp protease protease subunit
MNEILAKHTGRDVAEVEKNTERDRFMSAEEAQNYGIIDQIMRRHDLSGLPGGRKP